MCCGTDNASANLSQNAAHGIEKTGILKPRRMADHEPIERDRPADPGNSISLKLPSTG
jgi:hypothetical protein